MPLQKIQEDFVHRLLNIYDADEAKNIFELVIEHLTGINLKTNVYPEYTPDGCFFSMLNDIEKRLQKNEPIQYILNEAWFYDIPFYVDKHALIPRPETEELVDWIINDFKNEKGVAILDIGTGSGCIPIILKRKIIEAAITSCDISEAALKVAQKNALKYKTAINFICLDFLDKRNHTQLPQADVIVSNPPYIPQKNKATMHNNVLQHEPHNALFVDDANPLIFYETIASSAKTLLKPNGKIYVEICEHLGNETQKLFEDYGFATMLKKDMQGKNRMLKIQSKK